MIGYDFDMVLELLVRNKRGLIGRRWIVIMFLNVRRFVDCRHLEVRRRSWWTVCWRRWRSVSRRRRYVLRLAVAWRWSVSWCRLSVGWWCVVFRSLRVRSLSSFWSVCSRTQRNCWRLSHSFFDVSVGKLQHLFKKQETLMAALTRHSRPQHQENNYLIIQIMELLVVLS